MKMQYRIAGINYNSASDQIFQKGGDRDTVRGESIFLNP